MRHIGGILALLALAMGCSPAAPTLAGGKPVSHWLAALHAPDAKEREEAARKLGNVGSADAAACPALVEALSDPDARVRGAAILGLLECGTAAKTAVPTLQKLKEHDPDAGVRNYAGQALEKIQGGG
jgi:HEAT repeat protein